MHQKHDFKRFWYSDKVENIMRKDAVCVAIGVFFSAATSFSTTRGRKRSFRTGRIDNIG